MSRKADKVDRARGCVPPMVAAIEINTNARVDQPLLAARRIDRLLPVSPWSAFMESFVLSFFV